MRETYPGYFSLESVLDLALEQSAVGKGKERHANDLPFIDQPIMQISRQVGVGFPLGQAMKKAGESSGMLSRGEKEAAKRELLGAIVYLAAAYIYIEEQKDD